MKDRNTPVIVDLVNNPYTQRFGITFNNVQISDYSPLQKYIDEPFYYWCDKIFDAIHDECNGRNFVLNFFSRDEEVNIMKVFAEGYPFCKDFKGGNTEISISLQERLYNLNKFIRETGQSVDTIFRQCLFIIDKEYKHLEGSLLNLNVKNLFCHVKPNVVTLQEFSPSHTAYDIVFFIMQHETINKSISARHIYILSLDKARHTLGFQRKDNQVFLYASCEDHLFETIFECLLLNPLLEVFQDCLRTFPPSLRCNNPQIQKLTSIFHDIRPEIKNSTIEIGQSLRIKLYSEYFFDINNLIFSCSSPGIIDCKGFRMEGTSNAINIIRVKGMSVGDVSLYITRKYESDPFAELKISVIKSNRISSLSFKEDFIIVGEGDEYPISIYFYPENADNQDRILFQSDDPSIASIDRNGTLHARSIGQCNIICTAEQISARCQCIVRPFLQKITPESMELDLIEHSDPHVLKVDIFPTECIDDSLTYSSMNVRIVNALDNKLFPRSLGTTKIIIQNKEATVRSEVIVNVMTENEYRKKQLRMQKGDSSSSPNNSIATFFRKLIGRT